MNLGNVLKKTTVLGLSGSKLFGGDDEEMLPPGWLPPKYRPYQEDLYETLQAGLKGEGMFGAERGAAYAQGLGAMQREMPRLRQDWQSWVNRHIQKADVDARKFFEAAPARMQARTEYDLWKAIKGPQVAENERLGALGVSLGMLGQERGIASQRASMEYQSAFDQMMSPTFMSELMGGAGSAGGWTIGMGGAEGFSQQMAQSMAKVPGIGGLFS